jgi:hypothetical protein
MNAFFKINLIFCRKSGTKWVVGDEVVLAPTDFNHGEYDMVKITAVEAGPNVDVFTVTPPFKYRHFGVAQELGGKILDSRAEVALLTRNLQIYGDEKSETSKTGVHIKLIGSKSMGYFSDIEMRYAGKFQVMGAYPIHWHNVNDGSKQFAERVSIFKSYNRCFTIHCTNNIMLRSNTCTDHMGHGFFLEDGAEVGNTIDGNLGITTRSGSSKLVISDEFGAAEENKFGPATFWTINPDNIFTNNVAAGSVHSGFSFELTEEMEARAAGLKTCPERLPKISDMRKLPPRKFSGNMAHSVEANGLVVGFHYRPASNHSFEKTQAYKVKGKNEFSNFLLWILCCFYQIVLLKYG